MKCNFSKSRNNDERVFGLDAQEIQKSKSFQYFGLVIHKDWEMDEVEKHIMSIVSLC